MGLDGLLRGRGGAVSGILNGIDDREWNPATDPHLAARFDAADPAPRAANKAALQARFGLAADPAAPLFLFIGRLAWQKGVDLVLDALPALLGEGGQLAILGTGEAALEARCRDAAAAHPGRIGTVIGFDEALARLGYGGADAVLVPSRFEPCGLAQLCAAALRRAAGGGPGRRPGRYRDRCQRGGAGGRQRHRRAIRPAHGGGADGRPPPHRRAPPRPAAWAPAAAQCAGRRMFPGAAPPRATPRCSTGCCMGDGLAEPLGVTADADGVNVAVVAPAASAVDFCVFDATGTVEVARHRLPGRTGAVWHGHIPGMAPGARYGLRAHGPWDPAAGHRFNPAKLLVDPWATALDRPFRAAPGAAGYRATGRMAGTARPSCPRRMVAAPQPAPRARPPLPTGAKVIYELHVRGFTMRHPEVPEAIRGTFAGLGHPAAIAHLQALGVTHVELLPVAAWHRRAASAAARPDQLLGLQSGRLPGALPRAGAGRHGGGARRRRRAARRPASAPSSTWSSTTAARATSSARPCRCAAWTMPTTTGCGRTAAPLRQRRRLRQHPGARPALAAAAGDGCAAALGGAGRRRRLPLRPRRDARPPRDGFDPAAPLLTAMRQDPVLRDRLI